MDFQEIDFLQNNSYANSYNSVELVQLFDRIYDNYDMSLIAIRGCISLNTR